MEYGFSAVFWHDICRYVRCTNVGLLASRDEIMRLSKWQFCCWC